MKSKERVEEPSVTKTMFYIKYGMDAKWSSNDEFTRWRRRRFYLLILQRTTAIVPPKDQRVNFLFSRYDLLFMFLLRFSLVSHVIFLCFILLQSIVSPRLIEFPFPGQFTEDGSFIGQYVPGKLQPPVSPLPIAHSSQGGGAAPSPTGAPGMHSNSAATYV